MRESELREPIGRAPAERGRRADSPHGTSGLGSAHHHFDRQHQGRGNKALIPSASEPPRSGEVVVDERLGGPLRSYRRVA